jgi:redox-sensitive bicupin YhaK (pirin superfamily)
MTGVLQVRKLNFPWQAMDPFLICGYHNNAYPKGNAQLGPAASLVGRELGRDFNGRDNWRMYHGLTVPGFPAHPHRGFETVTIALKGMIDHSDSLGSSARFGQGDVLWLTAGSGIVHAEMFPLLDPDGPNPLEFFQIWLNLPARQKLADPSFAVFWSEGIPRHISTDPQGGRAEVTCNVGRLANAEGPQPLVPPPASWASQADTDVAIWTLKMTPGARWTLPAAGRASTRRNLLVFKGTTVKIDGQSIDCRAAVELKAMQPVELVNGPEASELLLLQGRPIDEPLAQHGPFVMNTQQELQESFAEYRRTEFGGWPWSNVAPVHGSERIRFAKSADGNVETPKG